MTKKVIKAPEDINKVFAPPTTGAPEAPWRDRKRVIVATLVFCALCVLYILIGGKDLAIFQTIVMASFSLAGSTVAFFIGAQTYHDVSTRRIDCVRDMNMLQPGAPQSMSTMTTTTVSPLPPILQPDTDER